MNNTPISNPDAGKIAIYGSISDGITLDASREARWTQPQSVFDVSECMLNAVALNFVIR